MDSSLCLNELLLSFHSTNLYFPTIQFFINSCRDLKKISIQPVLEDRGFLLISIAINVMYELSNIDSIDVNKKTVE